MPPKNPKKTDNLHEQHQRLLVDNDSYLVAIRKQKEHLASLDTKVQYGLLEWLLLNTSKMAPEGKAAILQALNNQPCYFFFFFRIVRNLFCT
jgi:hypothetical protein